MKDLPVSLNLPGQVGSVAVLPPNTFVKKPWQRQRSGAEKAPAGAKPFGRQQKGSPEAGDPLPACFTSTANFSSLLAMLLFLLLAATGPLSGQPTIQWDKTIGGSNSDHLFDIQQTSDGGYILGGRSISNISGDKTQNVTPGGCDAQDCTYDYWVVKLNANGSKAWDKTIGGSAGDDLTALQQTSDGGYILGGSSASGISGDKTEPSRGSIDYWVVKLDGAGNKVWDRTFGGTGIDFLTSLEQTADGGYILGGSSASGINGDKTQASKGGTDFWVVKLGAAGNKQWDKTFGGSADDNLTALQSSITGGGLSSTGYLFGGSSASGAGGDKTQASKGGRDYWIVIVDLVGNKVLDKTYGGTADDFLTDLQQTSDGGFILGGSSASGSGGDKTAASRGLLDYWIVKLDLAGNKTWDKTFGGSADDNLNDLQQTSDEGFILGGFSASGSGGDKTEASRGLSDFWVVKLDGVASKSWDKTIGGSGTEIFEALQQTSDGGYILGGYSDSPISGEKTEAAKGAAPFNDTFDYWAVKLAPIPAPGQRVLSFTLINTDNERVIRNLSDGEVINLATLPSRNLNIRINTNPATVGSVHYALTGTVRRVKWDNTAPYSLFGDDNGNYNKWVTPVGNYTLTATPYSGADVTGTAGTPLTIHFSVVDETTTQFTLTIPTPANGTVSKNPNQASYASGSTVNLTATPAAGYVFSGWGGDASGTTNPLPVLMNSNKTITATFTPVSPSEFTLTVPTPANGTVSKDPDQASYTEGATVTLTATPAAGFVFAGWGGDASGNTNPLEVIMDADKTITASFTAAPAGQQVVGFTLINTDNETVIFALTNGQVINLATLPSRNLNIRINTNPATVGSVHYALTGTVRRVKWDNTAPYSLFGDDNGNYNKWVTPVGNYSLTATPYSGADVTGTAGTPLTINFSVIDEPASTTASKLAQVQQPDMSRHLLLYPNPTSTGQVTVQLGSKVQGSIRYSLVSLVGQKLAAGTIHLTDATSLLEFDFSGQLGSKGVYYLTLQTDQVHKTFRIVRE